MNFPDFCLETIPADPTASVLDAPYIECLSMRHHEFRHVNYACLLCDRRNMNGDAVQYHCEEPAHQENVQRVKDDKERAKQVLERWNRIQTTSPPPRGQHFPITTASFSNTGSNRSVRAIRAINTTKSKNDLLHRVEQLGLPSWKDAAQAALFRYMMAASADNDDATALEQFGAAVTVLEKHEHLERLALLELAVWKAVCLAQMPGVKDYYSAQQWLAAGWKNVKPVQRKSNAISIVMTTVLPFLDEPSAVATTRMFAPGATSRPWGTAAAAPVATGRGGGRSSRFSRRAQNLAASATDRNNSRQGQARFMAAPLHADVEAMMDLGMLADRADY